VLREAVAASPDRWRELVQKYSPAAAPPPGDKTAARPPIDVPGDLGFLSREPDEPMDDVPPAVREALFRIDRDGGIHPAPVTVDGRHHVVRLVSRREARQRSLAEVDTQIRLRIIERREAEAKNALLSELRRKTSVKIDDAALDRVAPVAPASAPPATP
jgi:hypothetical protein